MIAVRYAKSEAVNNITGRCGRGVVRSRYPFNRWPGDGVCFYVKREVTNRGTDDKGRRITIGGIFEG